MSSSQFLTKIKYLVLPFCLPLVLSGCPAMVLAPIAVSGGQLASGSQDGQVKISLDENTLTTQVKQTMKSARHWAIVSDEQAQELEIVGADKGRSVVMGIKGLELYEKAGIRVSVMRPPTTPSKMLAGERKSLLEQMCATTNAELALFSVFSDSNEGSGVANAFLLRSVTNSKGSINMLRCKGRIPYDFGYSFEAQTGMLASARLNLNDSVAIAFAKSLIAALDATAEGATSIEPTPPPSALRANLKTKGKKRPSSTQQ